MSSDIRLDDDRLVLKGDIVFEDLEGRKGLLRIEGDSGGGIAIEDGAGQETVKISGEQAEAVVGGGGRAGSLRIRNESGADSMVFDAIAATVDIGGARPGSISVRDGSNNEAVRIDADLPQLDMGAGLAVLGVIDGTAQLHLGKSGKAGFAAVGNANGEPTIKVAGKDASVTIGAKGHTGTAELVDGEGRPALRLEAAGAKNLVGTKGNAGDVEVSDVAGVPVVRLDGDQATVKVGAKGHSGTAELLDTAGGVTVRLSGAMGQAELRGVGCAEEFELLKPAEADAGTVLVIEEDGKLRPCDQEFDRRVAGIVAGSKELVTGITLDRLGGDTRRPVALAGKVMCKVDATNVPVEAGDLLTTSKTPGHAMKAEFTILPVAGNLPPELAEALEGILDQLALTPSALRAFGATIGKALAPLKGRRGLIPVLVAL